MRRTLLDTATFILVVGMWLVGAPVGSYPTSGRRTLTEPPSARHRDDLVVGSDFLDMYIGTTVNPSARSRRYPISRSAIDHHNRPPHERRLLSGNSPQTRFPQQHQYAEPRRNFNVNQGPLDRLSSSSYQNQHNYFTNTHHQQINKVKHHDNGQENLELLLNNRPVDNTRDLAIGVSANKQIEEDNASENRGFGKRTIPRTSRVSMSTSSTREPAVPKESFSSTFTYEVSDEVHRMNPSSHVPSVRNEVVSEENTDIRRNSFDGEVAVRDDFKKVPVKSVSFPIARSYSVSSSVQKYVSRRDQILKERKTKVTNTPILDTNSFSTNIIKQVEPIEENYQNIQTPSPDVTYTSRGNSEPTTYFASYPSGQETTTLTTVSDLDTTTEESNEEWTTKPDIFMSTDTFETHIPDSTQSPVDDASHEETPVHIVSVRISSSVAQSHTTPHPLSHVTSTTRMSDVESTVIDNSGDDEETTTRSSKSYTVSLVTEEQPAAPSIQRSEFNVEEPSASDVTSHPQTGYSSFYSSAFQSPTSNYYQTTSVGHENIPSLYRQRIAAANAGSRVQFFSKSPSYQRGLSFAPLRRESLESSNVEASVVESNRRSYSVHTLPRISIERSSASITQSLGKEPVTTAESIQRSVIASQTAEKSDASNREKYHQDKAKFGFGRQRNFEGVKRTENPLTTDNNEEQERNSFHYGQSTQRNYDQEQKIYSEPEKVYGEPEKVYGEPEKVYGEPEKVYGEPEKVYSEPAKNYGTPEQNYEVDESVSVLTNGRAHGIQPTTVKQPPAPIDTALKVFDTRQQDPNHKFGYVVEGRDFRKYRVEERTSDGFIVGEYGVVSNDGDSLRGVRYTADGTTNPRLIYDTLLKFLSL